VFIRLGLMGVMNRETRLCRVSILHVDQPVLAVSTSPADMQTVGQWAASWPASLAPTDCGRTWVAPTECAAASAGSQQKCASPRALYDLCSGCTHNNYIYDISPCS